MKLVTTSGLSFSLHVTGYQFPNSTKDEYDSNWINVTIILVGFSEPWTSNDPSLLTWELKSLADWLGAILSGSMMENEIRFMEPNLAFQLIQRGSEKFIRTSLDLESKPEWYLGDGAFSFDLEVNDEQILNAIESLHSQLERFPGRGEH